MTPGAVVGVTSTTVSFGCLVGYAVDVFKLPAMSEAQMAAAAALIGVVIVGIVHLVGPIAQALSDRLLTAISPKAGVPVEPAKKEVSNA